MAYTGIERRIHKVYVTRNTEYHVRRDRCVAVRSPSSGRWLKKHPAIGQRIACILERANETAVVLDRSPAVGDALCFEGAVLTSRVTSVERPPREVVETYAAPP